MFQQILDYLNAVPFFTTPAFGILALVIVGSSWCLVGLVMGDAPKKNIEPSLVQFCGALFSVGFSLLIMFAVSAYSTASPAATFISPAQVSLR